MPGSSQKPTVIQKYRRVQTTMPTLARQAKELETGGRVAQPSSSAGEVRGSGLFVFKFKRSALKTQI